MADKKPMRIQIGKEKYVATVLQVKERDVQGRPLRCDVVHDDKTVKLEGGEEFIIVYMRASEAKGKAPS